MGLSHFFKTAVHTAVASAGIITAAPAIAETEAEHALRLLGREYAYPVCYDDAQDRAEYLMRDEPRAKDTIFTSYAGARYLDEDLLFEPAILYNPDIFNDQPDIVLDFVFAHECYHLNSGDARMAYTYLRDGDRNTPPEGWSDDIEIQADCDASRRMRDEFHYTALDMSRLLPIIMDTTSGRKEKQARLDNIETCYGEDIPFETLVMAGT